MEKKMNNNGYSRRSVVLGMTALGMMSAINGAVWAKPIPENDAKRRFTVPSGACDCHHHIYDSRFPTLPGAKLTPPPATVTDYRALQRRLGTTRNVIVTPSAYGIDNRCLLDALAQMGAAARGIAVINSRVTDDELEKLNHAGVRGIRVLFGRTNPVQPSEIETLAQRIKGLGWQMQFYMPGAQLADLSTTLRKLPTPVVLDHMGHIPQPQGENSAAYKAVRRLLDSGNGWVKLSGAYMDTRLGPPDYPDTSAIARSYITAAPERVVWGSNWPHPAAQAGETPMPDDMNLFNLLAEWAPSSTVREQILVRNPEVLFGFDAKDRQPPAKAV
jgi:D-galactarolactone isomerase